VKTPLQGLLEQIAKERQDGTPVREIARRHGVSRQAVYDLLRKAEKKGHSIPWQKGRAPRECRACGKTFAPKSQIKSCSPECTRILRGRNARKPGSRWSKLEFVELTCHRCGKTFNRTKYQQSISKARSPNKKRNFCGRGCYHRQIPEESTPK